MNNEEAFVKDLVAQFEIDKKYSVKIDVIKYKGSDKRKLFVECGTLPHDIVIEVLKGVIESYEKGTMLR